MLRVEKLNYEVKGRLLLKDVSFQIRKGEVLALLGANGAGKSTLMKVLCGEYKPSNGLVSLHGQKLDQYDARLLARSRAMLSQQQHVSLAFKVEEIVMMGRYPHFKSRPAEVDIAIVKEVMCLCGVDEFADRVFSSLSGGEQQRVQLARSLAQVWENPDSLLLLDEPISALDMHYQQKVLAIAKALARRGFIVVIVVHDVNFAATYADRIIMLKHGRKLFDGSPVEVLTPTNIYTIFSVEASVELNPRTLRPYIRLEEMPLDAYLFNSKLPDDRAEKLSLRQKRELLLAEDPFLSLADQANRLQVAEIDLWMLDKSKNCRYIAKQSIDEVFRQLVKMGEVTVFTRNACCTQKTVQVYEVQSTEKSEGNPGKEYVKVKTDLWHAGIIVNDKDEEAIHFFDRKGALAHGIRLRVDSDRDAFRKLLTWCEQQTDYKSTFDPLPKLEVANDGVRCEHYDMHKKAIRPIAVRRFLSACAALEQSLEINVFNNGYIHNYRGKIKNLVDQGFRYMVKDERIEMEIFFSSIDNICLDMPSASAKMVAKLDFLDQSGILNLQISSDGELPEAISSMLFEETTVI
ncbi:heme ABC transporter ATP-binding protein [Sphingobacterium bambusae]|uniref:Heme ABC transporter ATP-binding protein n=1 Tax=Sphingobacterium bambusae TaxID=662858 RepID=A0ABW6BIB3_9SPHI|nr:heme ABC transporter ATP-binding protein [Sphingobacterium bambusae]WPL48981.1 heme ABC transporter ATP-binding protein [Sphingobacterium bambusae]